MELKEMVKQKEEELEQKEKELEQERQRADQERLAKEQKEKELEQEQLRLIAIIKNLHAQNFTPQQIASIVNLQTEQINKILENLNNT
ncbi:MAG: hypothetical protein N3A01_09630 [Bacteroidales bacterium]|nr:hypothetical protein [Bacteroidales bacterium]